MDKFFYVSNSYPVVGVVIDISRMVQTPSRVSVQCRVDLASLGISDWSSTRLSRVYEIPKDVKITVRF